MPSIVGDDPRYRYVDRIDFIARNAASIPVVRNPALVEITGDVMAGTVLGQRTADQVYIPCDKLALDGSAVPVAVAYKMIEYNGGPPRIVKTALQFRGPVNTFLNGDFIHASWGATAYDRLKAVSPLLRFAGLVETANQLFSWGDTGYAAPVTVALKNRDAWGAPTPLIALLRDHSVYQHIPSNGDAITLPADVAKIYVDNGWGVVVP